ncbi:TatD family hydrolase [Candidatus Wolfebacteria bacterium]|nr:TatD family hydrolase [Candidatus Wolfebacteria bacterium]
MLFDTHSHLQFDAFNADREEIIKKCLARGIFMINVGTQKETSRRAVEIAHQYGAGVFAAVGLHPNHLEPNAHHDYKESNASAYEEFDEEFFRKLAADPKVVAIGETGLDYYRLMSDELGIKEKQKEVFKKHIELAIELGKPLIIHCRNAPQQGQFPEGQQVVYGAGATGQAHADCIEVLESYSRLIRGNSSAIRASYGVIHSFGGTVEDAWQYRALGFKIAFNGIITFARDYDDVVCDTPLDDILVETDCPYLTPIPHRGKRNEPSYVCFVAEKIAELKNIDFDTVARQTTENAKQLFRI